MRITKEEIIEINKKYGGCPLNISNLDFDLDMANEETNVYRKSSYIIRGIVSGHSFSDGCKSTAGYVTLRTLGEEGIKCDEILLSKLMVRIAMNKPTINQIEKSLRKICKKN